jgi:Flp pilus assembly protein TadG
LSNHPLQVETMRHTLPLARSCARPTRDDVVAAPPRRLSWRRSSGQAVVEFTLILPAFLLLMLIAVDFGRLFFSYIQINNAAREGASYAATNPTYTSPIQAHILNETNVQSQRGAGTISPPTITCAGPTGTTIDCAAAAGGLGPGNTVKVGITEPFTFFTPLVNGFFGNNLNIAASATAAVLFYSASSGQNPPPTGCTPPHASFAMVANANSITTNPSASTPNSGTWAISGYNWNWGDGKTDVGAATSTTHTYASTGTYDENLTVTNQCGSDSKDESVTIGSIAPPCTVPISSFTSVQVDNKTFTFTDTSTVDDPINCPKTAWAWTFGDGTSSNAPNPTYTYHDGSAHTVTLIVTNRGGPSLPYSHSQ